MVNECLVFYKGDKGLLTYDNKKVVFEHNGGKGKPTREGLGVIVKGTEVEKGNYSFAEFENVESVIPKNFYSLGFFKHRGLPTKVEVGSYGDNIFVKETYKNNKIIRAYTYNGDIIFYEIKIKKSKKFTGPNMYYDRIDNLVESWVDKTEELREAVLYDISKIVTHVDREEESVKNALDKLPEDKIRVLSNGVVVADGNFESLVIWVGELKDVGMAWLGFKLEDGLLEA